MPSPSAYALFLLAALVLLVIPGPAVLYVVSQSIDGGRRAAVASVLGISVGTLVHTAFAAVGISSLLVASATAFDVVRYIGAAYLIFLGLRRLLVRESADPLEPVPPRSLRRLFGQGVVVNVLNPKTALFVFAFLPQFVDVHRGHVALQIVVLGASFAILGLFSDGAWGLAAVAAADRLRRSRRFQRAQRFVSGGMLLGLGAVAAVSGSNRSH
jgi:threonine/homoserine/homoserine lactone efflux protein